VVGLFMVIGIALGVTAVIAGGYDDSPGAQLLGLVLVIATLGLGIRALRRQHRTR
jgi:hypothetical protein